MKLLIIGGTGVLSSAVVNEALVQGFSVTIVNRGKKKNAIPSGVELIKADYRNETVMREMLEGRHFDAVIDFICYTKQQIEYSINLLHSIAEQYVFISTTCVYNTELPGVKNEDSEKVLKSWSYSVDKWECEKLLTQKAKELDFNYTIIRPCVTYDNTRIPYGIMPPYGYHWTFIARILNGKPILRWDSGTTRWNMMRVEDFAVGVVGILGNKKAYGEAFNLSGDDVYTWNDVLSAIEKTIGVKPIIFDITSQEYMQFYPDKKGEISGRSLDAIVDNSKIKSIVPEYATKYSLNEGIAMTINAYKEENYQRGIDYKFDGDTDRIIATLSKRKNIDIKGLNLHFIDYLGNASRADKRAYWLESHKNNVLVKICIFSGRAISSIIRKIKK